MLYKDVIKKITENKYFKWASHGFALIGFFLTVGFFAVKFGMTNTNGVIDTQRENFLANVASTQNAKEFQGANDWQKLPEWATLKAAIVKDLPAIKEAARDAGVPSRVLVSSMVSEQLRLFFDEREFYKNFLAPLKVLGNETQFSLGVMGVKQETATVIEKNLSDKNSPFYLGPAYEHILDFPTTTKDIDQARFARLTDDKNHYFNYLYGALYLRQIMAEWQVAGYSIENRPEILATLFNIGFAKSKPNGNPHSGGAEISIGGKVYSFGSLAGEFYYSNELLSELPR